MPKHTIHINDCPECGKDLAKLCFRKGITAGYTIRCPECGKEWYVGQYHEGNQSYYTFNIG